MSIKRRLARFNQVFANRLVGRLLARLPGFGALHHKGRTSGRMYRTPVKVFRNGEKYVISMPYGADSDWVKNVLAAGGCVLVTGGRRLELAGPKVYEDTVQAYIPAPIRAILLRIGATSFVELGADPDGERRSRPGPSAA